MGHGYRPDRDSVRLLWALVVAWAVTWAVVGMWPQRSPEPSWDGDRWACPDGYSVYASEAEARAGKPFVHCVR
jgi:hypothetical protein